MTQERVLVSLECLYRGRLHKLPGQPVRVLCHLQREEINLHVEVEHLVFYFMAIAPRLVTGHH